MGNAEEIYSLYEEFEIFIEETSLKNLITRQDFLKFEDNKLIFQNIDFTAVDEISFSNKDIKIKKQGKLGKDLNNFDISMNITINSIYDEPIPREKESEKIADIQSIKGLEFKSCILNALKIDKDSKINKVILNKSIVKDRFEILEEDMEYLDLTDSTFHSKVEVKNCSEIDNAIFTNTTFKNLADFYNTNFYTVNFEKTTFENISVFTEATFHKDVDFKYTTFGKLALFRKTKFKGTVNFQDSIFKEEANFLDMNADMANRETARIIKDSFEKQNNIIEANRFYALEMKEREKELTEDIKKGKNIFEWLVFKAHAISSNHSQDWVLALLWILNIGFIYSMCISTFYHNNMLAYISIAMVAVSLKFNNTLLKIVLSINLIIFYSLSYIELDDIADKINPFSIMTSKDTITFGLLIFKITIAYLIYQFIVSVRQNTRRK